MKKLLNIIFVSFYFISFNFVIAAEINPSSIPFLDHQDHLDFTSKQDFRSSIKNIIDYFLTFLGLLCVIVIVYAAILLITDMGGEENTGKAKNILLWAIVGIILILLSYSITAWVFNVSLG